MPGQQWFAIDVESRFGGSMDRRAKPHFYTLLYLQCKTKNDRYRKCPVEMDMPLWWLAKSVFAAEKKPGSV